MSNMTTHVKKERNFRALFLETYHRPHALMRQLAERRELMVELVRLDNPQADLDRHRFDLLQRADHFAIQIASTSPHCRDDVLALAELTYDLAGTPVIRRAASHIVLGIKNVWT